MTARPASFEALLHYYQIAENQLGLDVFEIAQRIHRSLFMGHGLIGKQAQHMREGIRHSQAGHIAGVAQVLLRDGWHVHVFHSGMRDLGRFEELGQRLQAGVRHLGDAGARGRGAHARLLMHAGENREERGLAYHGQADNCGFHVVQGALSAQRPASS